MEKIYFSQQEILHPETHTKKRKRQRERERENLSWCRLTAMRIAHSHETLECDWLSPMPLKNACLVCRLYLGLIMLCEMEILHECVLMRDLCFIAFPKFYRQFHLMFQWNAHQSKSLIRWQFCCHVFDTNYFFWFTSKCVRYISTQYNIIWRGKLLNWLDLYQIKWIFMINKCVCANWSDLLKTIIIILIIIIMNWLTSDFVANEYLLKYGSMTTNHVRNNANETHE